MDDKSPNASGRDAGDPPRIHSMLVVTLLAFGSAAVLLFQRPSETPRPPGVISKEAGPPRAPAATSRASSGGLSPRDIDEARRNLSTPTYAVAPAGIELSAAAAPSTHPDVFARVEDEIAWTRSALAHARAQRDARATFLTRAQRRRDALASADVDPSRRAELELRSERVRVNYDRARSRVAELETRLARLTSSP